MAAVTVGDTVRIRYVGKLADGTVFDSTEGGAPLEFKVGDGEFLAGLEQGVIGMDAGETKTIRIAAENAYGLRKEERVFDCERKRLSEDLNPAVGQSLQMYRADGMPITVTIIGVSEDSVKMDCNHHLAGKDLIFDVTLEEIL
jgi:peptidylprolyl isomerase